MWLKIDQDPNSRDLRDKTLGLSPTHQTNPTFKKRGNCFVNGKPEHHASQCCNRLELEKVNPRANLSEVEVIATIVFSKVSIVTNMKDWIANSGASISMAT